MWLERDLSKELLKLSNLVPCILLTGARQTGKTSLLKQIFPDADYISFDSPALSDAAESSPDTFLNQFDKRVILDEIQYVPSLFRHLKVKIDNDRKLKGKWILTGSQKFELMKEVSESLAGRLAVLELDTLSIAEVKNAGLNVDSYLLRGGFPELWVENDLTTNIFFNSYVLTYLERDLQKLLAVSDLRAFNRFLRSCALRVAQLTNFTEMSKDAGVTSATGKRWFQTLETSNICYSLEPFFSNHLSRLVKSPKIYFRDQGLLNFLLNIFTNDQLKNSILYGHLFENLFFNELYRQATLQQIQKSIYFYRDKNNLEIDFVIEQGNKLHLIEVKSSEYPKEVIGNLQKVSNILQSRYKIVRWVACQTNETHPFIVDDVTFFNPLKHQVLF